MGKLEIDLLQGTGGAHTRTCVILSWGSEACVGMAESLSMLLFAEPGRKLGGRMMGKMYLQLPVALFAQSDGYVEVGRRYLNDRMSG